MVTLALLAQLSLPSPLPAVLQLAQRFSGSVEPPRCQRRGETGEDLGSPLAMYCVWPRAGLGVPGATLTARVGGPGGPILVQWDVPLAEEGRGVHLADSLGTYLEEHGFTPKTCGDGNVPAGRIVAVQWHGHGMSVHVAHLEPAPGKQARFFVLATDTPAVIHPLFCQ